jgi:hypothetical protein
LHLRLVSYCLNEDQATDNDLSLHLWLHAQRPFSSLSGSLSTLLWFFVAVLDLQTSFLDTFLCGMAFLVGSRRVIAVLLSFQSSSISVNQSASFRFSTSIGLDENTCFYKLPEQPVITIKAAKVPM